jgi:WD40 repeat protein
MTQRALQFGKVEAIFDHVVQLPRGQWTQALDELCAADAALRQDVESLLVNASPIDDAPLLTEAFRTLICEGDQNPNVGRRIGPYMIRRHIGAGGMGNVYLAVQVEPVSREVALKLMKRGLDTEETIQRFQRERQVLAGLQHPSIAQLLDAGSTDDGLPFFVMEYVEGEPITTYCDRRRLTIVQRLRLFQSVCAAVHFAHQHTVIHRDLKPANILVTQNGVPKLLDFGIAKLTNADGTSDQTHVLAEDQFLTPAYASPEQIHGNAVTTATDVYSLGVILYELLVGSLPFGRAGCSKTATTVEAFSPSQKLRREIAVGRHPRLADETLPVWTSDSAAQGERSTQTNNDCPPGQDARRRTVGTDLHSSDDQFESTYARHSSKLARASAHSVALSPNTIAGARGLTPDQLVRCLKADLDNIVLTAIASDPQRRYSSAEQFAGDIERHLRHEPVIAAPPSIFYRSRKFIRRNRTACVFLVLLCVGLIGSVRGSILAARSRDAALVSERAAHLAEQAALHNAEKLRRASYSKDLALAAFDRRRHLADNMKRRLLEVPQDLRDWEWEYLSAMSDDSLQTWRGHMGEVRSVAFSPDGEWVASGDDTGEVRIWATKTATTAHVINRHQGPVNTLSFDTGGRKLITGGSDGLIQLHDTQTGQALGSLNAGAGAVVSIRCASVGGWLAAGYADNTVRMWDAQLQTIVRTFANYDGSFDSLSISPDSRLLAGASTEKSVYLWDTASGNLIRMLNDGLKPACSTVFSPNGQTLAVAILNGPILLWDVESGNRQRREYQRGWSLAGCSVAFSPDGQRVASSGYEDRMLAVWDVSRATHLRDSHGHDGRILSVAFSPDGSSVITGSTDHTLKLWDASPAPYRYSLRIHQAEVTCIGFSPDGRILVSGDLMGNLLFRDPVTRRVIQRASVTPLRPQCLAFTGDGRHLAIGGRDGTVQVRSTFTAQPIRTILAHTGFVNALAASPNGRILASGGEDSLLQLWNVDTGERIHQLTGGGGPVNCVAFSPDGSCIASAHANGSVLLWNADRGLHTRTFVGHRGPVHSVAFSGDGKWIASGSDDETLRVYETTGTAVHIIDKLSTTPMALCFTPSGRRLFAGSTDGTVCLWDYETPMQMLSFHDHEGPVGCLALSPDGHIVVSGGIDRAVAIRDAIPFAWKSQLARDEPTYAAQAFAIIEDFLSRGSDAGQIAAAFNIATNVSPGLKRRILNDILERTARGLRPIADWDLSFFTWEATSSLDELNHRWSQAAANAKVQQRATAIAFDWKTPPATDIPHGPFGMVATGRYRTHAGDYRLAGVVDDGVRVWIDGQKVIDHWSPYSPQGNTVSADVSLTEGEHPVRVEYFQLGGGAYLNLSLQPMGEIIAPTTRPLD